MSTLNYCGGFLVHHIIFVYFLTKTDIISLHVNVDDSNVQNKQICVQLHFIALRRLSIKLLFIGQVILTPFHCICRSSILTAKLAR